MVPIFTLYQDEEIIYRTPIRQFSGIKPKFASMIASGKFAGPGYSREFLSLMAIASCKLSKSATRTIFDQTAILMQFARRYAEFRTPLLRRMMVLICNRIAFSFVNLFFLF